MTQNKYKLLIVEDDETLSEMYKIKFEKEWFEVLVANNWFDASIKIWWFKPNVILLDIMMPDMDWFETLKVFRQQTSLDTKIIMFSNLDKDDDIKEAMKLWADDYLIKANVTPKQAVEKVYSLLNVIPSKTITCPHCWEKFSI